MQPIEKYLATVCRSLAMLPVATVVWADKELPELTIARKAAARINGWVLAMRIVETRAATAYTEEWT